MQLNKILNATNGAISLTNLFGAGVLSPVTQLEGIPIGTVGNSPSGELVVKVSIREGTINVGTVTTEGTATAAAPSYVEGQNEPFSLNLNGDLRTITKIASGQTVGLVAGVAKIGQVAIDQTTPGTTNAVQETNGLSVPPSDYQEFTYIETTNNIDTMVFKTGGSGGTTVATFTFTYVGGGASDNDLVESITKS